MPWGKAPETHQGWFLSWEGFRSKGRDGAYLGSPKNNLEGRTGEKGRL